MTGTYVPGTLETDPKKLIYSLQQLGPKTDTNTSAIATIQAAYVTSIAGNHGAFTLNATSGITNSTNDIVLSQASASQFGAVKVDGTTITASSGVISAATQGNPWILLNTLTASNSATLSDTTSLTSTYRYYELVFENIVPATNNIQLQLQVHSTSFQTTGYLTSITTANSANNVNNDTACIPLTRGASLDVSNTAANGGFSGTFHVFNPAGTSANKMWTGLGGYFNTTTSGAAMTTTAGMWNNTAAIDGFQVKASTGNLTSGSIKIYGRT